MNFSGTSGDDLLEGLNTAEKDKLNGKGGDDTLHGYGGVDNIDGGAGNDFIDGWDENDVLAGGKGLDTIYGGYGDDKLDGGADDDDLYGGFGNDKLDGGNGRDFLSGSEGSDTLKGGGNDDFLDGGYGVDRVDGGSGNDTIVFDMADLTGKNAVQGGNGIDTLMISPNMTVDFTDIPDNYIKSVEVLSLNDEYVYGDDGLGGDEETFVYGDTVILNAADVLAINDKHTLTITGSENSEVDLSNDFAYSNTVTNSMGTFDVYKAGSGKHTATVLVEHDIDVSIG